ncbi:MAG: ribbon-helix-helix protein, CopG family [Atopobiaceae bacterium]
MSTVDPRDKNQVFAVAEGGVPVTGAMIDEWNAAYDEGRLPDGYAVEGRASSGRPPLHGERMSSITVRIPQAQKLALEEEARAHGVSMSVYIRRLISLRSA